MVYFILREKNKENNKNNNRIIGSSKVKAKVKNLLFCLFAIFFIVIFLFIIYNNLRADIRINGSEKVVEVNTDYQDEGATATYKGKNISREKIKVSGKVDSGKIGIYELEYSVKNNGIISKIKRKVEVKDTKPPIITLNDSETCYISLNSQYIESGYEVSDNFDKDLKDKVRVVGEVDVGKLGEYKLKYEVEDCSNNRAVAERTVIVTDSHLPLRQNSTIYLTFDDGNSGKTFKILDILKKEKIKATFFVVGTNLNSEIMKKIVDEGHAIGLHSDTHRYEHIYSSPEIFFRDLENLSKKVKNITGVDSKIIRFPGGSSNSISKRYALGIMSHLINKVNARGYHYFDWNVDSRDTGNINEDQIYQNVISGLGVEDTYIVLFHDIEKNQPTINALAKIIKYGKNYGYKFDKITMSTKEIHHNVIN